MELFSLVIGLAGLLLALLLPEFRRFLRLESSQPIQIPELDRKQNARFSFSFLYPVTWDRHDPANGDGYRFQNPKDSRISIVAWGAYHHLAGNLDSSFDGEGSYGGRENPEFSRFANELINRARLGDCKVLGHRAHGLHTFRWREEDGKMLESREDLPGLRIKREFFKSGTLYISLEVWALLDAIEYAICFQAPISVFKKYEDLALAVVSSLRILRGDHSNHDSTEGMDGNAGPSCLSTPGLASRKAQSIPIPLVIDMPYSAARFKLIEAGWQHMALPAYGYNQSSQRVVSESPHLSKICNVFPELEACSAQGHCKMRFFDHQGNQLFVVTYGPVLSDGQLVRNWWLAD